MARELSVIVKELESALTDVQSKRQTLKDAEKAMNAAAVAHREAQDKAATLKLELESVFNAFVPVDQQGRVRQS